MTEGSSQGLFVIVAVVIFGIFVLISYMLFRDKLQVGLATIFDDSIENVETGILKSQYGSKTTFKKIGDKTYISDNVDLEKYDVAEDSDFEWVVTTIGYWKYIGTKEYVIIPHIIKGEQVTSYSRMFEKNSVVKGVYSDNTNITDMSYMFLEFKSEQLELDLNTSSVINMTYMFRNSQAKELDLRSFDTSNVKNMNSMFYGSKATSLDLSSFNTSSVTDMSGMFYNSQATEIDLSSFDTSNVTDMSWMFYGSKATELDLSSLNTSKVTNMYGMFQYSRATTLDLSSFDTSSVTTMNSMFTGSQAKELDLRLFDTSNVTNMSWMFWNSQATTITLGDTFDTSSVTNMRSMFSRSQATEIDFSKADFSKVSSYDNMFSDSKIENIYVRTPEDSEKLQTMGYTENIVVKE